MRLLLKYKFCWLLLLPLALVVSAAGPASARKSRPHKPQSKKALTQKLSTVKKQIHAVKTQLAQKKKEQHIAKVELNATEQKLNYAQDKVTSNKIRLADSQHRLKIISDRLVRNQRQLERRGKLLSGRLSDIYKGDDLKYVDVLLGSEDMRTFLSRGHYIKKIVSSDVNLIEEIKKARAQIERDKKAQSSEVRQISMLQADLIHQRDSVASLADERQSELNDIEHDRALYEKQLDELQRQSQEIEDWIRQYQATPIGRKWAGRKFVGGLGLPVSGRITCRFGYRIHPITHVHSLHTGVDIACPTGTPVHAAAAGVVIRAGWMGAYGNGVVIDHGGGVQTLYGHNSRLLVHVGQQVSRGQVIAHSGSTGWSTGPHCHFEKRVNGRPVNPL